jgi:hypothetical protein
MVVELVRDSRGELPFVDDSARHGRKGRTGILLDEQAPVPAATAAGQAADPAASGPPNAWCTNTS